jgi:hypothetical protein
MLLLKKLEFDLPFVLTPPPGDPAVPPPPTVIGYDLTETGKLVGLS